jgi:Glycosyltransferase family 87
MLTSEVPIEKACNRRDDVILLAGLCAIVFILFLPDVKGTWTYVDTLRYAASVLKGQRTITDVTTDFVGFRALLYGGDPYALLSSALKANGVEWDVHHASTHPPTAYLLVAPVALLPIGLAVAVWSWLMVAALAAGYRKFGFSWHAAAGLALLTILWPPAAFSLPQLTPLWFLAVAWALRSRSLLSGAVIGIASLTKFFPAILLCPFVLRRNWRAVLAFGGVWLVGIAILAFIDSTVFQRYYEVNQANSIDMILRSDNASALAASYRRWGWIGVGCVLFYFAAIWIITLRNQRDWDFSVMLYAYLSVAGLPIFWIYSALPLLLVLIWFMSTRAIFISAPAVVSFFILLLCPKLGPQSVPYIAFSLLLPGAGFLVEGMFSRLLKKGGAPAADI